MALWRDMTAGAVGPGQDDYDPYGDLSDLVKRIAPGIGTAAQASLQPQLQRPDDSFAAYMADPMARSDADIQQRAAAGPPSAGQSLADLGNMVLPYLAGAAPGGSLSSGIRAYHGSPYDFNAFDASKIGTGEGAQAYGHGLYFAENEPTAMSYRDNLSNLHLHVNGEKVGEVGALGTDPIANAAYALFANNGVPARAKAYVQQSMERQAAGNYGYSPETGNAILKAIDDMKSANVEARPGGHMYEVDLNADPQQFLNWDKPLSEQAPEVQQAMRSGLTDLNFTQPDAVVQLPNGRWAPIAKGQIVGRQDGWPDKGTAQYVLETTGQEAEKNARLMAGDIMRRTYGGQNMQAKSESLRDAGIPGIRYLDQGSRGGAGQGSSNYVVFDPKIIDILRKYAVPGLITGGGAAGVANAGNP